MKYVQNYCEFYIVLLNILYKQLKTIISKNITGEEFTAKTNVVYVYLLYVVCL